MATVGFTVNRPRGPLGKRSTKLREPSVYWRNDPWRCENDKSARPLARRVADLEAPAHVPLPTRSSPAMTFEEDITVEWRSGDVW